MVEDGLIIKPNYDDIQHYLEEGEMTKITEDIQQIADVLKGDKNIPDSMIVRNIITFMNRNVARLRHAHSDKRKFKRSAQEILASKERTGCSDSATLFRTLAIACGIPTMQIIGIDKEKYKNSGHFYSGVFLSDIDGDERWQILDSDQRATNLDDVKLDLKEDIFDRNIGNNYMFAYALDYREINIDGKSIDSIDNMNKISCLVYDMCDKKDMKDIECR